MRIGAIGRAGGGVLLMWCCLALSACRPGISIGPAATTATVEVTVTAEASEVPTEVVVTETPSAVPTDTPVPPTPAPTIQCTENALRGLHLRGGPGTEYPSLAILANKDALTATVRSTEGDWVAVQTGNGTAGWVASNFVNCEGEVSSLPETTPGAPPAPGATSAP
jgi:hypothetical protein